MLQNKINGILGIWVFLLAFLGFSETMHRFLLVITGIAIAVIAFGGKYVFKPTKELIKETERLEQELKQDEEIIPSPEEKAEQQEEKTDEQTQQ